MSDYERELLHIAEMPDTCAFCGSKSAKCQTTHVIPRSIGIKPGMHNTVYVCEACTASKGEKDFVEWWRKDLKRPRDQLPRVPLGLYLKITYECHKINFSLKKSCQSLEQLFMVLK